MARTWMILARVIRVVQPQGQAQHAAVGEAEEAAQAQADDAAVGEAEEAVQAQAEQAAVGEAADAAQAQAEHAAVGGGEEAAQEQAAVAAQAEQAAVEEAEDGAARTELEERVVRVDSLGEPDFTVSVAPPPRVTFLTALPNATRRDHYPYIIASGPFCLLTHFALPPNYGTDLGRSVTGRKYNSHQLIVVRHFRRAGGQIAATSVRVPTRPENLNALKNIESIGLVCDGNGKRRTYNYRIVELRVDTGRSNPSLELVVFRSDRSEWFDIPKLKSPLVRRDPSRKWVPHGAVAVDSTVMWFDLSWGILSCDVEEDPKDIEFRFYRLPLGRGLGKAQATEDIHNRRCIGVSGDLLRYVEIILPGPNGEAATVSMWSLEMGDKGWRWIANYRVSFEEIWNNNSYALTGLPPEIPVVAGVCPANPDVVYFDLHHRLFGVNVPERRVVDYEANQHQLVNVPGPGAPFAETGSSRYLLTWNLLRPGRGKTIGHVSPELQAEDFPGDSDSDDELKDPKGKAKAMDRRRKSTSASSWTRKSLRIK